MPEKVIIRNLWSFVVNIIDGKVEILNFFEVIVYFKYMSELRIQAVLHVLGASNLAKETYTTIT